MKKNNKRISKRNYTMWHKESDEAPRTNDATTTYFVRLNQELRQENRRLKIQQSILLCGIGITVLAWGVALFACLAHFYK